jgi:hypothetical protein
MPAVSAADIITGADKRAQRATAGSLGLPDVDIKATLDPQDFVRQSKEIAQTSFASSGIGDSLARVKASGDKAVRALDIIESQYKQDELKKVPLEAMQKEVDRLMSQKLRVLPDILGDTSLVDPAAKMRIATRIEGMFQGEIDKILDKKESLETAAENRAKVKVDELKAKASMLDKQNEMDRTELSTRVDLFKYGSGSLQDILEAAVQMAQNNANRAKAGQNNPFIGMQQSDIVSLFKVYEAGKAEGKSVYDVPLDSSATAQQKAQFLILYDQWRMQGRPGEFVLPKSVNPSSPFAILERREIGASFLPLAKQAQEAKMTAVEVLENRQAQKLADELRD